MRTTLPLISNEELDKVQAMCNNAAYSEHDPHTAGPVGIPYHIVDTLLTALYAYVERDKTLLSLSLEGNIQACPVSDREKPCGKGYPGVNKLDCEKCWSDNLTALMGKVLSDPKNAGGELAKALHKLALLRRKNKALMMSNVWGIGCPQNSQHQLCGDELLKRSLKPYPSECRKCWERYLNNPAAIQDGD